MVSAMARSQGDDRHEAAVAQLRQAAFFEGFNDNELRRVAELAEEIDAEAGAELTDQGRPGQTAYVILEGTAAIEVGGKEINQVGPGDMVGEMALIDHRPRTATVRALTAMRLLAFDANRFRRLLDEMPKAQVRVMEQLVERLRQRDLA
jgi:CRP/FNR family transcriptional regulator, cyclic AMP receptor protein